MRLRLLLAAATLLFMVSTGSAQVPFDFVQPANGTVLRMSAEVDMTDTALVTVTRLSPTVLRLMASNNNEVFLRSATDLEFSVGVDTVTFLVVFAPTISGTFTDTLTITDGLYQRSIVIIGESRGKLRWVLQPPTIDFGVTIIDETTPDRTIDLYNNSNTAIALSWNAAKAPFSITGQGVTASGTTQTVSIAAKSSVSLSVNINAMGATPGIVMDTIFFGDGAAFDGSGSLTQSLQLAATFANRPEPAVVVFTPDVLEFDPTQGQEPVTIKTTMLRNAGPMAVTIATVNVIGVDASAFQIVTGSVALPAVIEAGDSMEVSVAFDHSLQGQFDAQVTAIGYTNSLIIDTVLATCYLRSSDTTRGQITRVRMTTNNANVGEIARATFTNETAIASEATYALISLRYNATVLVPETPTVDAEDPIVDGYRTSRFKVTVSSHDEGEVLGAIDFRVALGNASNTSLEVTGFEWYTDLDEKIDVGTSVNGTVVSVLDADGNEVNVDPGPLSLSVTPMPVTGSSVVTYTRGELPVQVKMFDAVGNVVADLTSSVQADAGTFNLQTQGLPTGMYYLRMTGGRHVYVLHVIVE